MYKLKRNVLCLALCAALLAGFVPWAAAYESSDIVTAQWESALYIMRSAPDPEPGTAAGDRALLALARSGQDIPESYYNAYISGLTVKLSNMRGVLGRFDYSAYARAALTLTAMGGYPTNAGGWNLLMWLADAARVQAVGADGLALALLALDAQQFPMPVDPNVKKQATRDAYISGLVGLQGSNGGWAAGSGMTAIETSALALHALAPYAARSDVATAQAKAVSYLAMQQKADGGYEGGSAAAAQVVAALCAVGVDPDTDTRFAKGGKTLVQLIMDCRVAGGGFSSQPGGAANLAASEYCLMGLSALRRMQRDERALYDMLDVTPGAYPVPPDPDFIALPVLNPDGGFTDIAASPYKDEIVALARRGLVSGMTETEFVPGAHIRRAEVAAMLVNAMGLRQVTSTPFTDLPGDAWYTGFVGAAWQNGLVTGVTDTTFQPLGYITREQAAVILSRSALRLGADTRATDAQITESLAAYTDGAGCSAWARDGVAYCVRAGLLPQDGALRPRDTATRGELAHMLYVLLQNAGLI